MNVYDVVTKQITEQLEKGVIPWRKPWNSKAHQPQNMVSKHVYRGINVWLTASQPFGSPYWLTFDQIQKLGGRVKPDNHGTPVIFWKFDDEEVAITDEDTGETTLKKRPPLLRFYKVWNLEQTEGIPEDKIPKQPDEPKIEPIKAAEAIVEGFRNKPRISHGGDRACYSPAWDSVTMPKRGDFISPEEYYSTLFHELTHSTGHESRLKRFKADEDAGVFHAESYSREELVAEMGASFLDNECGILPKVIENNAAYIQAWLKRLGEDTKLIVHAAAQAQKAVDHILDTEFKRVEKIVDAQDEAQAKPKPQPQPETVENINIRVLQPSLF